MNVEDPENAVGSGRVKSYASLAAAAENGHLDSLECPVCHRDAVSAWFSNPAAGVFRTWFLCRECSFSSRTQNAGQPRFFSQSRRRTDLEERDREILSKPVFRSPESST
jgi:hypothetical protein